MKLVTLASKTKRSSKANKRTATTYYNPWLWILTGTLIGVLISSILFIKFGQNNNINISKKFTNNAIKKLTRPKAKIKATKTKATEPIFDFYTVLPKMHPATTTTKNTKLPPNNKTTKVIIDKNKATTYLVELATFTHLKDADELKAQLTLNGFEAHIKPIQKNNTTWYQLTMGPFATNQQAIEQQQLLIKQHNISSNIIKMQQ